jgi:hypothetical protein
LLEHARERHASSDGQRLRYRNGRRITFRRYDLLPERLGRYLSWIRTQFSPDADLVRLGKVGKMIMPRLPGTACWENVGASGREKWSNANAQASRCRPSRQRDRVESGQHGGELALELGNGGEARVALGDVRVLGSQ